MSARLIDGNAIAAEMRAEMRNEVAEMSASGFQPGLAVILVGEDAASQVYVRNKEKDCEEIGIRSIKSALSAETGQDEIMAVISRLNDDPAVHGILCQLPLPGHIDEKAVLNAIDPDKDVDGFHPVNVGRLSIGEPGFVSCTPGGIMELLRRSGVDPDGKEAVIVGRSNIVGKPAAMLLMRANATVTVCHSRTKDLPGHCRRADILIVAIGRPRFVTADMVKEGAVVIDVGMNRTENGLAGDVDFQAVAEKASQITPVPGGVGPMTRAMLMRNTVDAAKRGPA